MSIYDKLFADPDYNLFNAERYELVKKWLLAGDYQRILDVGCGRGNYLKKLLALGLDVTGAEPSRYLIENDLKNLPVIHAGIVSIKGEWDALFCMDVLEHLPRGEIGDNLKHLSRLAPHGLLGIANHDDEWGGQELHLIQEDSKWWREMLQEHFKSMELVEDTPRFFCFEASNV